MNELFQKLLLQAMTRETCGSEPTAEEWAEVYRMSWQQSLVGVMWMLREVMAGGNFGRYAQRQQQGLWRRFFAAKRRRLHLMRFDFWEVLWCEVSFWERFIHTLPERIRRRSWSLAEAK